MIGVVVEFIFSLASFLYFPEVSRVDFIPVTSSIIHPSVGPEVLLA
jgi:hypothetical protein